MEANNFETMIVEVVTGDEVVVSKCELDRMLRYEFERGQSEGYVKAVRHAQVIRERKEADGP